MNKLEPLTPEHYEELYAVLKEHDPLFDSPSFDHFETRFQSAVEGWVVKCEGCVVGMVALSDFVPGLDVILHGVVHPAYRGRWLGRRVLRTVFGTIFNVLNVPRASGYMVVGINDQQLAPFWDHIGFKLEGYRRKGFLFRGRLYDRVDVGMIKEECRWIRI